MFFTGREVKFPENNDWEKFVGLGDLRSFLICADSWARNGWEVRRLTTLARGYTPTPFLACGNIQKNFWWYPAILWRFIGAARAVAQPGANWFTQGDVFNLEFWGRHYASLPDIQKLLEATGAVYFQVETFTLATFVCTPEWLDTAEKTLMRYDNGELPEIKTTYVCEDQIFRQYGPALAHFPRQKFSCVSGPSPLIHYARVGLPRAYLEIPSCPSNQKPTSSP